MTTQERRDYIGVQLQNLIRKLIDPKISKRELLRQEQMAWDLIRDSRSLSANSQEVNRRLAALVERFRVENMTTYGETIKNLSEKLLSNPCINISQSDQEVLWSLLELVLEMIYEPVQNIRRNRGGMEHRRLHNPEAVEDAEQSAIDERSSPSNPAGTEDDWVALLSEDLLPPPSPFGSSSDNLSDWTDSDDPSEPSSSNPVPPLNTSLELLDMNNVYERAMESERAIVTSESNAFLPSPPPSSRSNFRITQPEVLILNNVHRDRLRRSKLPLLPPLKPPKLATVIELSVQDPERLPRLVHSYKWGPNVQIFTKPTNPHPMANFAVSYVQFLKRNVCGLIDYRLPSTTSEVYLLREILFMFVRPNSCQFFEVNKVTHKIKVREHISICSVTEATIRHILNTEVLRALHDMWKVRRLIESNIMYLGYGSTGTLGCFLYGVKDLLQPISAALLEYEVLVNAVPTKGSLLDFVARFREPFRELHILRRLVDDVVLNIGPRFLRSAFLLSKLYMHTMPHVPHQKMAIALLMISLKRYMNIIDAWWSRASLEDFQSEFIVERWVDEVDIEQSGAVRRRTPGEDEDPRIKKVFQHVQRCPFYRLLLQHALDSGDSQELLANVGLLGEMLSATNDTKPLSLYEELADQLITQVKLYSTCMPTEEEVAVVDPKEALIKQQHNQLLADAGSLGNPDLRTLFVGCVEDRMEDKRVSKKMRQPLAAGSLLKRLEGATRMQLRVEVPEALGKILLRRQTLANVYAMRAYTKELRLGGHLRFLRHSMLLEGYFILLPFYQSLFRRIESGETWTRASQLTSELCEVQYTHYPKFATGMRFAVTSKVKSGSIKVYEALDGLEIAYDMSTSLHRVIRRRHMEVYNAVWRLMLKIKWALWKLENLPFIRRPKGDPYAPLDLLGLTVRRLEILRFWLMYLINSLHTHIMECLGQRVETEIGKCTNIRQMKNLIDEHTTALKNFCLLSDEFTAFRIALEQLFHLVFVLDMEWTSCTSYLSDEGDALALDASMSDDGSRDSTGKSLEYLALNQVGEIELTYIRCHQTLGEILNSLVYKDDHGFLTALEVAINTSVPY